MRRFPRGSHLKCLTTFVTYTRLRSMPASSRALSRRFPAGPTNGRPCRSSELPGCSPTNITVDVGFPSPNTVCVPVFQRWQALHSAAASCSFFTVGLGGISGAAVPSSGVATLEVEALAAPECVTPARFGELCPVRHPERSEGSLEEILCRLRGSG